MLSKLNSWPKSRGLRPNRTGLNLLLGAVLLAAMPAWAGKHAYGETFVRVGQSWTDAGAIQPRGDAPVGSEGAGDDSLYQRQVAELEQRDGPYSDALAEPLAGLGRYYQDSGDMEQALRLYQRALHVVRVNEGLYSERQIPILRELLNAYRATGEIELLDNRYDYYFRLYGNGRPPYTDVRLRAALGYLRWQREAVRLDIDEDSNRRMLALYQLNDELLSEVAADSTVQPALYRDLVQSQVHNLYLLEDRFAPALQKIGVAPAAPVFASEWDQEDFHKKRLEVIQRDSLSRGSDLLRDVIERSAATAGSDELARLHLELGDWYQWHGKDERAAQQYQQVVQLLSKPHQSELLQRWLGQPVELPDNGAFWQPRPGASGEPLAVVSVRYDVSATGRVSNLEAVASDSEKTSLTSRLKRQLRQTRFRPRWISGVAESAAQIQRDYALID